MNIKPPNFPLSGMYYHIFRGRGSFNLLYFYPDGFVMGVTIAGDLSDLDAVKQWFSKENWGNSESKNIGHYQTANGQYIHFDLCSDLGKVVYTGEIQEQGKYLQLYNHSHINGNVDNRLYHLLKDDKEKDSTCIAPDGAGAAPDLD